MENSIKKRPIFILNTEYDISTYNILYLALMLYSKVNMQSVIREHTFLIRLHPCTIHESRPHDT
jgi:hypothetical protein